MVQLARGVNRVLILGPGYSYRVLILGPGYSYRGIYRPISLLLIYSHSICIYSILFTNCIND